MVALIGWDVDSFIYVRQGPVPLVLELFMFNGLTLFVSWGINNTAASLDFRPQSYELIIILHTISTLKE